MYLAVKRLSPIILIVCLIVILLVCNSCAEPDPAYKLNSANQTQITSFPPNSLSDMVIKALDQIRADITSLYVTNSEYREDIKDLENKINELQNRINELEHNNK
jgi:peptidoglycan hydrolase CwlO-like protein